MLRFQRGYSCQKSAWWRFLPAKYRVLPQYMGSHRAHVLEPTNICFSSIVLAVTIVGLLLPLCTVLPLQRSHTFPTLQHDYQAAYKSKVLLHRFCRSVVLQVSNKLNQVYNHPNASRFEENVPQYPSRVTLPSFTALCRTLERPGCGPGSVAPSKGQNDRNINPKAPATHHQPASKEVFSAAVSITSSASSPISSFTTINPNEVALSDQTGSDAEVDKFSSDPRTRALAANQIIHHHFGQLSWWELVQIKCNVDASRPLFGSDTPSAKRGARSTKKHSMAERGRRSDHQAMLQEQGRRMPNRIFELAGYQTGSRKPPGKHPLHVATLLMFEFDNLIQAKLQDDNRGLREQNCDIRQLLGRSPEKSSISCARRPSATSEEYASSCGSPRKRKRNEHFTASPYEIRSIASPLASSHSSQACLSTRSGSPSSSSALWSFHSN